MKGTKTLLSYLLFIVGLQWKSVAAFPECYANEFQCKSGKCINSNWKCDGNKDCGDKDNSDEEDCSTQPSKGCHINEFTCGNKKCIDKKWRCDNRNDCGDWSDEKDCKIDSCSANQFKCKRSGHCVSINVKCDMVPNCLDASDEALSVCPKNPNLCKADEFRCSGREECIPKKSRCDQVVDCLIGEADEENCSEHVCDDDLFQCGNGKCISPYFECDGAPDCDDGTDENKLHCKKKFKPLVGSLILKTTPTTTITTKLAPSSSFPQNNPCKGQAEEFFCPTAETIDDQCISKSWLCDGEKDCPDGRDEWMSTCKEVRCEVGQFKCNNGICTKSEFTCDGIDDCGDNSDEADELCYPTVQPVTCMNNTYQCKNSSKCIPMASVCNDVKDCPNEDDEDSLCDVRECETNNGGCSNTCVEQKLGYKCMCNEGYRLDTNEKTCIDIDECILGWEVTKCSQECMNLKGSFKCKCHPGYKLDVSGKSCLAEAPIPDIVFADVNDVRIINSKRYNKFVDAEQTSAVAIDMVEKMIYWADLRKGTISRAPRLSSLKSANIISDGLKKPESLAVDWIGRKLYWIDTGYNNISVSNLDGKFRKTLIKRNKEEQFRALAVHPAKGYIFWTDIGTNSQIERANLDGTSRQVIIRGADLPTGLTVDTITDRIYWSDMRLRHICSSNLDGTDLKKVVTDIDSPLSLTVFEDLVYWTSMNEKAMYKANKFDGSEKTKYAESFFSPMDIAVYHTLVQIPRAHPCNINNGGCSHLCLFETSHTGMCACPDNMIYGMSLKSCIPKQTPTPSTVWSVPKTTKNILCRGYQCHSSLKCLPKELYCDGVPQCPEHDDETNCNHELNNTKDKHSQEKSSSITLYILIAVGIVIVIIIIGAACFCRKRQNKFDLSMIYETERDIVHEKDINNKSDVEIKYVLPDPTEQTAGRHYSKTKIGSNKNFENINYKEAKTPLHMEDDESNSSEDNSSGDLCFESDRQPILSNIV